VGLALLSLKRIRVGPVQLGNLPEGRYRELTEKELNILENTGKGVRE
jgi:16S rRNA U516 pseudouridylate synthase RsuA-like enzyme